MLGMVDIASTRLENVEEIRSRLLQALRHIDASRLMAAPDCGLVMLSRQLAVAKLRHLVAAASSV
jgi:5-methyltetrahydropteroyltriglutamate--homocysteine methyltransferase